MSALTLASAWCCGGVSVMIPVAIRDKRPTWAALFAGMAAVYGAVAVVWAL